MLPDPRKSKKAFVLLSYQLENQESDITGTRKVAFLHILFRVQKSTFGGGMGGLKMQQC